MTSSRAPASVQSTQNVSYELHSLGWKSFQDLCVTVLGAVLGQIVQRFFDSSDGGRDGAFSGVWKPHDGEALSGSFTVQCKFTGVRDRQLNKSDLSDELDKAKKLAKAGFAANYILMTNAHVKGTVDKELTEAFQAIPGIRKFISFGHEWISSTITESPKLRMLVPRVYGLGDLSQILDERAYRQAMEILSCLGNDLSKFVITDAYRKSARAISDHGFVLLIGEPASGKSTIAAALSLGATDQWGCDTLKIRSADEFAGHWNPNHPKQLFWVDDAFGATQFDRSKAAEWNQTFAHLYAATKQGARVVFTSRDYIYNAARSYLKASAFPLIAESQVVIRVEELLKHEREQILYNHIRLGGQDKKFRSTLKPLCEMIASHTRFRPEIARRLGDPMLTKNVRVEANSLKKFIEYPKEHLIEVIKALDAECRSAIAVIFMRGGSAESPLTLRPEEQGAVGRIGGNIAGVRESLNAMKGSLVSLQLEGGIYYWRFKHPTIRDAFAEIVAEDVELLDTYLAGTPIVKMLNEISCGDVGVEGVKVVVPRNRYDEMLTKLVVLQDGDTASHYQLNYFLSQRCDRGFLELYLQRHSDFIDSLSVSPHFSANSDVGVLARLHEYGLLPEENRKSAVAQFRSSSSRLPDASFLNPEYRVLLTESELADVLGHVKTDLLGELNVKIQELRDEYSPDEHEDGPAEYFGTLQDALLKYRDELVAEQSWVDVIDQGLLSIEEIVEELHDKYGQLFERERYDDEDWRGDPSEERCIFDDIDV
jgi:hypothetical protein